MTTSSCTTRRSGSTADPALLLINGLGSQCINYRLEWCERFAAAGFFVIRFDNRDVGLSTGFDDAGTDAPAYAVEDMAGDAVAVLDAANIDRAHVLGVSMGGMIVQRLAIDHADRLRSMTSVMSTTGDADVGHPERRRPRAHRRPGPAGPGGLPAAPDHLASGPGGARPASTRPGSA